MKGERLSVFTRYPEPGKTKTRLIPALGADCAACLQRAMTSHALSIAARRRGSSGSDIEIRYDGGDGKRMRRTFGSEFAYRPQGPGHLGDRMQRCLRDGLEAGSSAVVIMGSDVPGIDGDVLDAAFEGLRCRDLVIGPSADGGYYLIGLRRDAPDLFQDIPWGTGHVLERTLAVAERAKLSVRMLTPLADVDRPEDLGVLERAWGAERMAEAVARISVIIPTLNEAAGIDALLASPPFADPTVDIIVVDGGSRDCTAELAAARGARVIVTRPSRARQMNEGAAEAAGGIFLFLHADTRPPDGFPSMVRAALATPRIAAGAFSFQLDGGGAAYRLLERLVNLRSRFFQMPYGDQALFMTARTFRTLGGFPELPIMEDFEMVRRLKRLGRIFIAPGAAVTSIRRWQTEGLMNTTILHQQVLISHLLRLPPRRTLPQTRE